MWDSTGSVPQLLMDSGSAYVYAGSGVPSEQVSLATGTVSFLTTDSLGSVRGVVSAAGALTAFTSYDAWGNPQTGGGLTSYTPFGYAGAYTDPDGLLYLINRYYDPATGQFNSVDPYVATTLAPYGYAGGDPVTGTDPSGLMNEAVALGGAGNAKTAAKITSELRQIAATSRPEPVPYPQYYPRPRPKPKPTHHCGGFWGWACKAAHWVGHQVHKHWKGIVKTAMVAAAVGLTVANGLQLGLDPLTDAAEGADIGAIVAEEGASAAEAGSGADNVVNGVRLAQQLTREEASSVFTQSGELQPEVIDQSHEIINGARLGNKALVNELTSDGSSISDWGKYTTPTFRSPSGPFQVHFYYNSVTDEVFYGSDYKAVFVGGSP